MPDRLRKFVEMFAHGKRSGRVAYVYGQPALPKVFVGAEWAEDTKFSASNEVLADPNLKIVFKAAVQEGCAVRTEK